MIASHHQCQPDPSLDVPPEESAGVWPTPSGSSSPDNSDTRSAGLVLNSLVALFQEISPPLNV